MSFNYSIPLSVISLVFLLLAYGAVLRSGLAREEGGMAVGWYSLYALKSIYFGLVLAVLVTVCLRSHMIGAVTFLSYQGVMLRNAKPRDAVRDFWGSRKEILFLLLFALLMSLHLLSYAAPVSSDDGIAHYSIVSKLLDGHQYALSMTKLMYSAGEKRQNFYFYPFLNHLFVVQLFSIYKWTGVDLPSFIAACIVSFIFLALVCYAAFVSPYRGKVPLVSLLAIFAVASTMSAVWQYAYGHGGGFRAASCNFIFCLSLYLTRDPKRLTSWNMGLLLITAFLLHTQAFMICAVFLAFFALCHRAEIKRMAIVGGIVGVIIVGLVSMHSSVAGNLSGDSHRLFQSITSTEMKTPLTELYATYVYLFIHTTLPIFNFTLAPMFLLLLILHFIKPNHYSFNLNLIILMLVCIEIAIILLPLLPDRVLPYVLLPFVGANVRLAEFMAPFCFILLITLSLDRLPSVILAAFLIVSLLVGAWSISDIANAAMHYHTATAADISEIYKVLPEEDALVFAGDRRYEMLGSFKKTRVATAYFDCPMPGGFQFSGCHRVLNQGFALQTCLMNDELMTQIKSDFPNRQYYFVTQSPWGYSKDCVDMKNKYLTPVLNNGSVEVFKLKATP